MKLEFKAKINRRYIVAGLIIFLASGYHNLVEARTYGAQLDQSQWYLSASIFGCSLVHEIPLYGQGVFFHEAGEDLKFWTTALNNPMKPGKAALVVEASHWKAGNQIQDLGYVDVTKEDKPIVVERKKASSMMLGLLEGMTPTFTRKSWFNEESIRVQLNSINFLNIYDGYLDCVSGLLPVNFRQVEKSRVHFKSDKSELTDEDKKTLDKLIFYVGADSSVTTINVDGHTDSSGRRIYNRRLSKARAESVKQYLIQEGIEEEIIRTRYHGERYPVAKNINKKNKSLNRRTTVRLLRGDE